MKELTKVQKAQRLSTRLSAVVRVLPEAIADQLELHPGDDAAPIRKALDLLMPLAERYFIAPEPREERPAPLPPAPLPAPRAAAMKKKTAATTTGPGTELKAILASCGVWPDKACTCNSFAKRMDAWGPEKCRANRNYIIEWVKAQQRKRGWTQTLTAGLGALVNGVAFKVNPLDPVPSLVDLAIERAEKKRT